jgi:hypothetical protein
MTTFKAESKFQDPKTVDIGKEFQVEPIERNF